MEYTTEQLRQDVNRIYDDLRGVRRTLGLQDPGYGALADIETLEHRVTALEYKGELRTILIYTSIGIGLANLVAVIGLYLLL